MPRSFRLRAAAHADFSANSENTRNTRNQTSPAQSVSSSCHSSNSRIERAVEKTEKYGLALKEPKTARGKRTIAIDDDLIALLLVEREKHLRIRAGVRDGIAVDLSLVKLPADALMFPNPPASGESFSFTKLRGPDRITVSFARRAAKLGFPKLRLHELRGTHETLLLDAGVPVHVVAAPCGHEPAVLLRSYAKRTRKADENAAALIGALSKAVLGK